MNERVGILDLKYDDCNYLDNSKSLQEQKETKSDNWYCPIKNQIVNKKYCTKEKCQYFKSFDQIMAELI